MGVVLLFGGQNVDLQPQSFSGVCLTTESVWACLHCPSFACGRSNAGHALAHFQASNHPLVMEINDKLVFCYLCDDYVSGDTPGEDFRALRQSLELLEGRPAQPSATRSGRLIRGTTSTAAGVASATSVAAAAAAAAFSPATLPTTPDIILEEEDIETVLEEEEEEEEEETSGGAAELEESMLGLDAVSDALAMQKLSARRLDLMSTVVARWRHTQLSRAFNTWRLVVLQSKLQLVVAPTNAPPQQQQQQSMRLPQLPATRAPSRVVPKVGRGGLVPGMTGLRNLGQTCFMNAVLQAMGCAELYRKCLNELGKQSSGPLLPPATVPPEPNFPAAFMRQTTVECHDAMESTGRRETFSSPLGRRAAAGRAGRNTVPDNQAGAGAGPGLRASSVALCRDLDSLFRVMWSGKWSVITPHAVLEDVWMLVPSFRGYKQQDAQELLCELQGRILDELQVLARQQALHSGNGAVAWTLKWLSDALTGQLTSTVVCSHCAHHSLRADVFCDLSLDFPSSMPANGAIDAVPLGELLEQFFADDDLGEAVYACDGCSGVARALRSATKNARVSRLPGVLRLHMKRFRWSGVRREKIQTGVEFPFELDLQAFATATVAGIC
jgi:ubiquitin carboxyl-terminal hydrolase 44/49